MTREEILKALKQWKRAKDKHNAAYDRLRERGQTESEREVSQDAYHRTLYALLKTEAKLEQIAKEEK